MLKTVVIVSCLLGLIHSALGQVIFPGQCNPNIAVVQNFNATRFLGRWNLIETYPSQFQNGSCIDATYSLGANGTVDVFNTQVISQNLSTILGSAVAAADGSGRLRVTFPTTTDESDYWILSTDYDTFSFVYSCANLTNNTQAVWSWKMSRTRSLTTAANTSINQIINLPENTVLVNANYIVVDHSSQGCFYFPEPNPSTQVRFRGTCDANVNVIQNFNVSRFLGRWNLIESYPSTFQNGNCSTATYTLGSGRVDVLNSQVINQTLDTMEGFAVVASTDGSARLNVSFPIAGTNLTTVTPYWVLATDYETYALIYTCINDTDEYEDFRQVWSWKMSRTRQLTPAGTTAINTITNGIQVLDDRYYQNVDQSPQGCFYFPVPGPSTEVRFRGTCDANVNVVENFNVSRFLGRWNLIESYPSTFQNGNCSTATYTLGSGRVDVLNSQVINQTLDTMEGFAVVASTDGSARLNVSFPIAGTNLTTVTPYWVLATDYETYALIYTCINDTDEYEDFRQVWSWKMSRTRQLTPAGTTAINTITNGIQVLDDRYYQNVDQSPQGCFYFPVPGPSTEVRFRGTCDANVNVVENFNVTRFLGNWNLIETYPSVFQNGDCSTATYSLGSNGVDVLNTQVINQTLDTMEGFAVVASTDGSARLNVTFPIAGTNLTVTMPYWVLATDYESYALIYTCLNDTDYSIYEEYRRVWSWKMSRTRQLTPAATTVINNVTNGIQVLDDRYYQSVNQTPQGCFYFPEPRPSVPVQFRGQCENIDVQQNFNLTSFQGLWHEIEAYPKEFVQGPCVNHNFTETSGAMNLFSTFVVNTTLNISNGTLNFTSTDRSARFNITINTGGTVVQIPFWIVNTNYVDYALAYSCVNVGESRRVVSWKLSRSGTLSNASQTAINNAMANIDVIDNRYFEVVNQDDNACFYYPVFDVLPPVITLRGQCDPTIRGIPNFNAVRYLGRWFEIEKYPQLFQEGQCSRAQYTLAGSVVDVFNTQVVNRTLLTQTGIATASADGTGQLTVTFNVSGVTNVANYYILATDYDTYALVYSCRNLSNSNREVFSWKLSRNGTLSAQANNVINNVVASTQGLLQDYYTITDQSQQACFYIPEPNPNQAVRMRASCANIVGQANFNLPTYLGWWHETQTYPTGNTTGTCISSRYTQAGSLFQFVDTEVFGLSAQVTRGVVQANTNGLLSKIYDDGRAQDLWVLGTDYNNYAVLLSCQPFDEEYVTVWSAVQRKTETLTAAAQQAISQLIASNDLLSTSLYLPVNQTEDACFHYPAPSGDRVILRGQCNPNIPVQASFDISEYTGTWYQIQRYAYPEVSANSTCIGTRYSSGSQNTVDILNWEVLNGNLQTIQGQATLNANLAQLDVTIPANANNSSRASLRILTTDYGSYSLMYTCENINPLERAVVAFKLSRTRSLSATANTAINNYMATQLELHQPLFLSVVQNENCDEPDSSYFVKSSIIVVLLSYTVHFFM